jgi:hypothetical protein
MLMRVFVGWLRLGVRGFKPELRNASARLERGDLL